MSPREAQAVSEAGAGRAGPRCDGEKACGAADRPSPDCREEGIMVHGMEGTLDALGPLWSPAHGV